MTFYLVLPVFLYVIHVTYLGLRMFRQRIKAVSQGEMNGKFFKSYDEKFKVPQEIQILSRHFDNQFQIPMLYFVTVLFALQMQVTHWGMILSAWIFLFSRLCHSYVHLGSNKVLLRAKSYFFGVIVLIIMWVQVLAGSWGDLQ